MPTEHTSAGSVPTGDEALAAQRANAESARNANLAHVAELAESATPAQIDAHIRALVAVTMAHLSAQASPATRSQAGQWQAWALDLAQGVAPTRPAAV